MPYAQCHYPFERQKEFEDSFPADFIAEGLDQTRGWSVRIEPFLWFSSVGLYVKLPSCLTGFTHYS